MKAMWKMWLGILMAVVMMTGMGIEARAAQEDMSNCLVYNPIQMTWDNKQINISGNIENTSAIYDIYELESVSLSIYDAVGNFAFTVYIDDMALKDFVLSPGETREFGITVSGSMQDGGYQFADGFYALIDASFTYQRCNGINCKICGSTRQDTARNNSGQGQADKDALQAEMDELMRNKPSMSIRCIYCGGDGKLDKLCDSCKGSGYRSLQGVTMFMALVSCPDCKDGYQKCSNCFLGSMINPDYKAEQEVWTEKRHDIWHRMGYTDAQIKRMEIDEAKAFLDNYEPVDSPCVSCNGSKKCWRCNGLQKIFNGFGYQDCTQCIDGTCTVCGGTGQN